MYFLGWRYTFVWLSKRIKRFYTISNISLANKLVKKFGLLWQLLSAKKFCLSKLLTIKLGKYSGKDHPVVLNFAMFCRNFCLAKVFVWGFFVLLKFSTKRSYCSAKWPSEETIKINGNEKTNLNEKQANKSKNKHTNKCLLPYFCHIFNLSVLNMN